VRGLGSLRSNTTSAENTDSGSTDNLTSYDSDGFTIKDADYVVNNRTIVGWNWLAGGTAASNTDGTITSSVSANPTAGFSIVSYTGNSTSGATFGHGLSQAPELVIIKNRESTSGSSSTAGWVVYSEPVGNTKYLYLNEPDAEATDSGRFNDTTPSASVVTLGDDGVVNNSEDFIVYCFHSVEGYSKVGSYVGNNNADGTFVYTGMKPAFVIVKRLADEGWQMFDSTRSPYNVAVDSLTPSGNGGERTDLVDVDIVSNGFKFRGNDGSCNAADDYIYIAFAESPFKASNAR